MILDLPLTTIELITAKAEQAGMTVDELLISTFAKDDEDAYYDWFYQHHFDIERLTKAIGETDENGRAKHTQRVPDWALADLASFDKWLAR
ncbi:Uncharacterised protein [Moraxella lacunata]|uniref:Uncharacterized protein n=1 Tax=Moraxella lacunata TaxID=477 RepID=A0A378TV18_MORLA|nr:hypothetical protein [Moraxella lacunata]STZ63830.1 Uncharacterised protein [Moraxella lacunata]